MQQMYQHDLKPLLKLALPLVLTGLIGSCIGFFETVFLAHLSHKAMAAGALVSWLFGVFVVIIFGTLSAINVLVSHRYGAKDIPGIAGVMRDSLLLAVLLSIPSMFLFWNMAPIFLIFGQKPSLVVAATPYLHALVFGLLPTFIVVALSELLLGIGHAKQVMLSTILSVAMTLLFSFTLIFGIGGAPQLGIAGAGWGTTLSAWIMMFVLITFFAFSPRYHAYFREIFHLKKTIHLWELLKTGLPMGIMYCFEVGFFFALTLIAGSFSAQALTANQIAFQYMGTLMTVIFSIAQAVTVRMGHLLGAKEFASVKRAKNAGVILSIAFMSFWAIVYWVCPKILISVDFDVHHPDNLPIVQLAVQLLAVSALFQLFEGTRITLFGALRALKDTRFTLICSIISFWGIALPVGYMLATWFHLQGVGLWWGMVVGAGFSMLLLWWRFNSLYAKEISSLSRT